jgi:alkylation response protein AidB-like acyl-CoA dehydrogenase
MSGQQLRATLDFLLYDWLKAESLTALPRFAEHSRETFDALLDLTETIAAEKFTPFNRLVDIEEPRFDGERVILPQATHEAWRAYADSGMLSAGQDEAMGGLQLPYLLETAANSFFTMASVSIGGSLLSVGNARLLLAHGTERQQAVFAAREFSGEWSGTMCLSEPQAGSSLSDINTRATLDSAGESDPLGPRYRLRGNKMWISAGEHDITENIVHLVLAKIPDANGQLIPGTKGISLFIVPKKMVDANGQLTGERNDVALAGLNHKCGWRGTTNTLLNFGEGKFKPLGQAGAVGYLVGQPGEGLRCMFHMMNEARIGIGLCAAMLGMAGFYASLDYARQRPQGRPMTEAGKDPASPQVPIIEHADVRRMLLAQKAYSEGGLALCLYAAKLVDAQRTAACDENRLLLEILTPIVKSFPSEWCLEANSLAIQIHGGYGYTRDFPVEQYWRDNRLNMIHEGTHGIQGLDLLGRKVTMEKGAALRVLTAHIEATIAKANVVDHTTQHAQQLAAAWASLLQATQTAWQNKEASPAQVLANAVPYLQAFGHCVIAWTWLELSLASNSSSAADIGRRGTCQYFYHFELPKIKAWLAVVEACDPSCYNFPESGF